MLYGYARVSTDKQDNSADAQQARLKEYADRAGLDLPDEHLFVDEDVTGSMPLKRRPKGQKLWDLVTRGDVIVFVKLDRGFRSMADAAHTLQTLSALGVGMVILDLPLDLNTPEGRLMFHQFAAFSQFERERLGQRTREVIRHLKKTGQPYGTTRPWGWRRKGNSYVENPEERALGQRICEMRSAGMSYAKIALKLLYDGVRKPASSRKGSGYYHVPDMIGLSRAAASGYPRTPQGFWLRRESEQRLRAARADGYQL
jgi:DNA invertase Pin-like site-specific DNA recombinase